MPITIEKPKATAGGGKSHLKTAPAKGDTSDSGRLAKAVEIRSRIEELQRELESLHATGTPKVVLAELHDGRSGRIDARKVAEFMGVALKPLSESLGLNYKAVHRSPSAPGFQKALRLVKRPLELLHGFFGPPESIRAWLNTPHPDLDGATALETILEGRADAVGMILENAWNGVPV
ncbi:MAG: hypothetical protein JWM59_4299 [Verrucomicrobiales bacterium]|nr:hypothetical protein [Verrucomicrobiales bacterium]